MPPPAAHRHRLGSVVPDQEEAVRRLELAWGDRCAVVSAVAPDVLSLELSCQPSGCGIFVFGVDNRQVVRTLCATWTGNRDPHAVYLR
jgi:hypothetical protein